MCQRSALCDSVLCYSLWFCSLAKMFLGHIQSLLLFQTSLAILFGRPHPIMFLGHINQVHNPRARAGQLPEPFFYITMDVLQHPVTNSPVTSETKQEWAVRKRKAAQRKNGNSGTKKTSLMNTLLYCFNNIVSFFSSKITTRNIYFCEVVFYFVSQLSKIMILIIF
jgi:hypothetical protein